MAVCNSQDASNTSSPRCGGQHEGIMLAPSGSGQTHFGSPHCSGWKHGRRSQILEVAKDWADNIQTGHLPRDLAWQSLTTTMLKKLEYSLPATTLTEAQCKQIMKPLLKVRLLALGVSASFPWALVFGPEHFQGLTFPPLCILYRDWPDRLLKFGI